MVGLALKIDRKIEDLAIKFIEEYISGIYSGTPIPQIIPDPKDLMELLFNHSSPEDMHLIEELLQEAINLKHQMESKESLNCLSWDELKELQNLAMGMQKKIRNIPATTYFLQEMKRILAEYIGPLFTLNFSRMAQPPFTVVPKEKTCFFEKKVFIPGTDIEVPEIRFYWGMGQGPLHNWKTSLQFTAASTPPGIRQPWHWHKKIGENTIIVKGELTRASLNGNGLERKTATDGDRIFYDTFTTHTLENESGSVVKNLTVKPRKAENDKIDLPIKGKELSISDLPQELWDGYSEIISAKRFEGNWGYCLEQTVNLDEGESYVVQTIHLNPGFSIDCDKKGFEITWVVEGRVDISTITTSQNDFRSEIADTDDWIVRFPEYKIKYQNSTPSEILLCRVINLTGY